jgi:hypothetical protein
VSERKALCWRVPDVAVMLTVEVTGVGVNPLPLVPAPQPETSPSPVKITASSNRSCKPRRLLQPKRHRAALSAVIASNGRELGRKAALCALALNVS